MFGKRARFVTMMAVALGIPYAWFNQNVSGPIRNTWTGLQGVVSSVTKTTEPSPAAASGSWSSFETKHPPIPNKVQLVANTTRSMHQLADVLRFDISPRWVIDNWGRVSTVRADQNLEGLRVPLVTGTDADDVAGSLTYYFDGQQRVRRITLHGLTGDERALVEHVTKRFGLRQEPTGTGTYVNRWNAKPMNVLLIHHAPVIRADMLNSRLAVALELNDLPAGYGLSPEFAARIP